MLLLLFLIFVITFRVYLSMHIFIFFSLKRFMFQYYAPVLQIYGELCAIVCFLNIIILN